MVSRSRAAYAPLLVARLTVSPDGGLTGLAMGELSARTRVLAIRRATGEEHRLEHPPRRPVPVSMPIRV